MEVPKSFKPKQNLDYKVKSLVEGKPNLHISSEFDFNDDTSYFEVVCSSLNPNELKRLGVVVEKFYSAKLKVEHKEKIYQIVFEPNLQKYETYLRFIDVDNFDINKEEDFKELIDKFVEYVKKCDIIKSHEEDRFRQSINLYNGNIYRKATLNLSVYFSPAAIGNFSLKFKAKCNISNIVFKNVTGKELKRYGVPMDKVVSLV